MKLGEFFFELFNLAFLLGKTILLSIYFIYTCFICIFCLKMKLKSIQRRWIFLVLFALGILFVFFLGRKFDGEKHSRNWNFVPNGVSYFRKGLDVSWGTRLVYQISYDKYEQTYKGRDAELAAIKKEIENILFKQIGKRISSLGVADAKVYKQMVGDKVYINVDIGGVSDLDQAKELIGKTVELEFRLPFKGEVTADIKLAREKIAATLLKDLIANPTKFKSLSENKGSESIVYSHWTGITLNQLPVMLKENADILDKTKNGEIFDQLIKWTYTYTQTPTQSGQVTLTPIEGFGILKLNEKKSIDNAMITVADVNTLAKKLKLTVNTEEKISKESLSQSEKKEKNYVYNQEILGSGADAYKVKVAFISAIGTGSEWVLATVKEQIKTSDSFSGAALLMNGWKTAEEIKATIPSFDENSTEDVKVYKELNYNYVVYTEQKKANNEYVYSSTVVKNIPENFETELKTKTLYDIEFVFTQDHEPWTLAKTANGKILNGAYFKYANAGSSSLGESVVEIHFNDEGKQIFCDITNENVDKQMAIFVGGELKTDPVIRTKICWGTAQISGNYTPETAKELSDELNDGALPAPLILLQEEKVSPVLGDNALKHALLAGLVGVVAIFVFMFVLYGWRRAVISLTVLLMFLLVLGFFMKFTDYALSLSAIAAIILSLGMAVDANILIFERMNEESKKSDNMDSVITNAYERSWLAIRDGQVSTFLIAFLLFQMGSGLFKGFGTTLIVTVLITLLVNVPLTKELLMFFYKKKKK